MNHNVEIKELYTVTIPWDIVDGSTGEFTDFAWAASENEAIEGVARKMASTNGEFDKASFESIMAQKESINYVTPSISEISTIVSQMLTTGDDKQKARSLHALRDMFAAHGLMLQIGPAMPVEVKTKTEDVRGMQFLSSRFGEWNDTNSLVDLGMDDKIDRSTHDAFAERYPDPFDRIEGDPRSFADLGEENSFVVKMGDRIGVLIEAESPYVLAPEGTPSMPPQSFDKSGNTLLDKKDMDSAIAAWSTKLAELREAMPLAECSIIVGDASDVEGRLCGWMFVPLTMAEKDSLVCVSPTALIPQLRTMATQMNELLQVPFRHEPKPSKGLSL